MQRWLADVLQILILLFIVNGCASSPKQALDNIQVGMDKDMVLETAGSPKRTFRENSQDHWVYVYFRGEQQWLRDVIFEDGKVAKVTQPIAKEAWVKDLEKAETMEEFEQKAREHQKSKKSGK